MVAGIRNTTEVTPRREVAGKGIQVLVPVWVDFGVRPRGMIHDVGEGYYSGLRTMGAANLLKVVLGGARRKEVGRCVGS